MRLAQHFGVPAVRRALDMLQDAARTNAPDCKSWVTMRDERVRASHFEADTQTIPANLRFVLDKADGVGTDLARFPRDPDLPTANRDGCRCDSPRVPFVLAESIHQTMVEQVGTHVGGSVETTFPRAAESEFASAPDTPALYMTTALQEVALRLQSGHTR